MVRSPHHSNTPIYKKLFFIRAPLKNAFMFICAVKCVGNTVKRVGNTDGECESGDSVLSQAPGLKACTSTKSLWVL